VRKQVLHAINHVTNRRSQKNNFFKKIETIMYQSREAVWRRHELAAQQSILEAFPFWKKPKPRNIKICLSLSPPARIFFQWIKNREAMEQWGKDVELGLADETSKPLARKVYKAHLPTCPFRKR
jgi:hypothetical protein